MKDIPAFPCHPDIDNKLFDGMTLRDYFAAKAMQGMMHLFDFGEFKDDPMRLAGWSYDAADAMLAAREKA